MPMTMDRLLLHAVPAVIFLAGWHWAEVGTGQRIAESTFGKTVCSSGRQSAHYGRDGSPSCPNKTVARRYDHLSAFQIPHWQRTLFLNHFGMDERSECAMPVSSANGN